MPAAMTRAAAGALARAAAVAVLLAAAAGGAPLRLGHGAGPALGGTPTCDSCLFLVKTLKCEVADVDTQAALVRLLAKDLCPQLPAAIQPDCLQLVPQLVPIAMMYLTAVSPKQLCSSVQLCGLVLAGSNATVQDSGPSCALCNFVILQAKAQLQDPATQRAVITQAHKVGSCLHVMSGLPARTIQGINPCPMCRPALPSLRTSLQRATRTSTYMVRLITVPCHGLHL